MTRPLRVLTYHRVLDDAAAASCTPSVVSASPAAFREQMRLVAARYRVLRADEVGDSLRRGRPLPRRAMLITFDDGCRDFGEIAWPILRTLGLPATVFVPTAYPDDPGRSFWWDRLHAAIAGARRQELAVPGGSLPLDSAGARRAAHRVLCALVKAMPHTDAMRLVDDVCRDLGEAEVPPSSVLGWEELRELARDGVTIGAHTRTHPSLIQLDENDARSEIAGSGDDLERQLGVRPRIFAYPFGAHDDRTVRLVGECGFDLAVTCLDGRSVLPGEDPLRLRRTNITPRTTPLVFKVRMTPAGTALDQWRHRDAARRTGSALRTPASSSGGAGLKVGYIMSRFPKLSETFVLNEIAACEAQGIPVEVYPLLRERQQTVHPETDRWTRRAHFEPFLSLPILRANARFLRERPGVYARLLLDVLRGTSRSANFLIGALGIFPKSVRFALAMREAGVTHVHAHFATHPALSAFIVHRLTGIPFSFTAHGSDLHVDRTMLGEKLAAARFAVTVSNFNREVMVRECGEAVRRKVHVVHCGVDPDVFAPRAGAAATGRFRIVCVASFEEVKGHRFLVEACRVLRDRGLDIECHLVGEGPLQRGVERRVAAAGLGRQVVFHGGLPRPDVARLLTGADAAVLASHPTPNGKREGIPVALMEAMAAGLPVVATAISGIPELVEAGVSGLLVPSGDPLALADGLARLAADPALRARMGRAGRACVDAWFNLHTNTGRLIELFRQAEPGAASRDIPETGRALAS